jgi:hypothetical protein
MAHQKAHTKRSGKITLLTADGLFAKTKAQEIADGMLKNGTFLEEFPECAGKEISSIRAAGGPGDLEVVLELVNLGWPIVCFLEGGKEAYGIPLSFRSRVDIVSQTIAKLN